MVNLNNSKTHSFLKKSFLEESSLMLRYKYYAKVADFDGQDEAAEMFREIAEAGEMNVHGSLDYLKTVGDPSTELPVGETKQHLISVLASETHEYNELYPRMIHAAKEEGFTDIASWFETLQKLKRTHALRLKELIEKIENKNDK